MSRLGVLRTVYTACIICMNTNNYKAIKRSLSYCLLLRLKTLKVIKISKADKHVDINTYYLILRAFKTSRRPPELRRVLRGLPPATLFWYFDNF